MPRLHGTKTTVLNLCVEMFFAVLPLIVLGAVWPHSGDSHTESFWAGPELSMTSCILYGLTLARLLQGAVFAAVQSSNNRNSNMHEVAASYAVLFLMPLLGAIISVILISKAVQADGTWRLTSTSCLNLLAASSLFLILGGHGLKWAEGGNEQNDPSK